MRGQRVLSLPRVEADVLHHYGCVRLDDARKHPDAGHEAAGGGVPDRDLAVHVLLAGVAPHELAVDSLVHPLGFLERVADAVVPGLLLAAVDRQTRRCIRFIARRLRSDRGDGQPPLPLLARGRVRRSQIWEGRQEPGDPHDVAIAGGASFKPRSCNASRTIWLVKPHSLSYQHITFARLPPTTRVMSS